MFAALLVRIQTAQLLNRYKLAFCKWTDCRIRIIFWIENIRVVRLTYLIRISRG